MNRDQTIAFLKGLGAVVPNYQPRSGWVISDCVLGPWAHDGGKSNPTVFGVRLEPGDAFIKCFSCDWHGSQSDLVLELRRLNKRAFHRTYDFRAALQLIAQAEEHADTGAATRYRHSSPDIDQQYTKATPHVFPTWWAETFAPWREVSFARAYLTQRSVPAAVADLLDLRADTSQRRVCAPLRDAAGRLMGLHGRAVDPETDPKHRFYVQAGKSNPLMWLGEAWADLERPLVIVEGIFDLASVYRVVRNVVSPLWANPSIEKLRRMADAAEIITLLDRGIAGDMGRRKMQKVFASSLVTHLLPSSGKKDPGKCSVEELRALLQPHLQLDPIMGD